MSKINVAKTVLNRLPSLSKMAGRNGLLLKKHSPELLIGIGIIGIVTSTVMACRAMRKFDALLDGHREIVNDIKYTEANLEYSPQDYNKDLAITYVQTGKELVKLYGPAVTLGVASIACILGAHNIMQKRNVALVAAYKAVEQSFFNYRQRVIEEFGERKDYQYRHGIREIEVTEMPYTDENGKKHKAETRTVEVYDPNQRSVYARFFDEGCANWSKTPEYNLLFIKNQQNYANDLLHSRGHVFLNEVYDMLGIDRSQAGAVVGWVMSKEGDNFVDFGMYDLCNASAREFVNGHERSILLDFNVDGVIYDLI